uniref:Uncharacterized protein n=1 Tax=Rhizophora mucronata TaxID=61149 RepID=A0A2P2R119_RHIMU
MKKKSGIKEEWERRFSHTPHQDIPIAESLLKRLDPKTTSNIQND